jgi:hypothetical protein
MTGKKTTASSAGRTLKKAKVVLEDEEETGLEDEEEATVTLSVEKDALECDICCLPFQSEVFMARGDCVKSVQERAFWMCKVLTIINYMTSPNNNQLHDKYII